MEVYVSALNTMLLAVKAEENRHDIGKMLTHQCTNVIRNVGNSRD